MRMIDIMEKKEIKPKGTYAAINFDQKSLTALTGFVNEFKIPKPLNEKDFHSTLIYSRNHLPEFEANGSINPMWEATPKKFEVWKSDPNDFKEDATYCLVMQIKCPELTERFHEIMDNHDATYDFDEYKPHVTLSYDVGEGFDVKGLKWSGDPLMIQSEYSEDLK